MLTCISTRLAPGAGSAIIFSDALNLDLDVNRGFLGSWNLRNIRQLIPAAALVRSGSLIRVTLEANTGGEPGYTLGVGFSVDGCYIGHRALSGDAYDFDGGQVQLTFNGSPSVSIGPAEIARSDIVEFALDNTKDIIVAMHFSAISSTRSKVIGVDDFDVYIGPQDVDETALSDVTGYTLDDATVHGVQRIEVAG